MKKPQTLDCGNTSCNSQTSGFGGTFAGIADNQKRKGELSCAFCKEIDPLRSAHLLPVGMTIDPRKVAELASIAVAFEMPDEE